MYWSIDILRRDSQVNKNLAAVVNEFNELDRWNGMVWEMLVEEVWIGSKKKDVFVSIDVAPILSRWVVCLILLLWHLALQFVTVTYGSV